MKHDTVTGGGGLKLHVAEAGNPAGRPILFIHGFSQCRLAWRKQTESELAREFRLIAMDIRGHGSSEKPPGVYGESKLWADDVHAVIETLGLHRPVLSGWSYGGVIMSDYIDRYGEDDIAGTNWVGAVPRLGTPLVQDRLISDEFLAAAVGSFSEEVSESVAALQKLVRLCVHEAPSPEDFCFFLGCSTLVPPHVRQGMMSRDVDNDPVVRKMRKPMLLSYGDADDIVPTMSRHVAGLASHARLSIYPGVGHAPFWEAPERFNRELHEFRASV